MSKRPAASDDAPAAPAGAANRIDVVRPDAPELARFGDRGIGVRTLDLVNPQQVDVLRTQPGGPVVRADRAVRVEVWYPAASPPCAAGSQPYATTTRDGQPITLFGRARRDAPADGAAVPFPLVVLSHGYPGNRHLLAHLGEHLASTGYVAAAIDHTDSTYLDQAAFASTLLHRPLDQGFVIASLARAAADGRSPLHALVDADRSAIVGFSMGGYGALNAAGAGLSQVAVHSDLAPPDGLLRVRAAGDPDYRASLDPRVRAVVAIGPWGRQLGFWDAGGLAGVSTPVLFVAGSHDDVSDYARGIRPLFEETRNAERWLLTFELANHNAAAPMPAPLEVRDDPTGSGFDHYADPVWDTQRMNDVSRHAIAAFLGAQLRGDARLAAYLDVRERAEDGGWPGFPPRTSVGLRLERRRPWSAS